MTSPVLPRLYPVAWLACALALVACEATTTPATEDEEPPALADGAVPPPRAEAGVRPVDRAPDAAVSPPADAAVDAAPAPSTDGARPADVAAGETARVDAAGDVTAPDTRADVLTPPREGVLPILWLTVGKPIVKDPEVAGRLRVIEDHDGTHTGLATAPATLESAFVINVRGSSSSGYAQKPYSFELQDGQGKPASQPMLGLPSEADFVLHSCYTDKSCMRNALSYALAREIGAAAGRWAARTRYVEVFIDGKYEGLYLLVERNEQDKNRLDLTKPAPDAASGDITGGYMISGEGNVSDGPGRDWRDPVRPSAYLWRYRYPGWREITPAQKTYIQNEVTSLQRLFLEDPNWRAVYRQRIDVPSWIDHYLLQELSNNNDSYWKSVYMYKESAARGGRFYFGPAWDFDIAFGNVNYGRRYCATTSQRDAFMWTVKRVWEDPAFVDEARCRWQALRKPGAPLDLAMIEAKLAAFEKQIAAAKARDVARWKNIGVYVWPNNYVGASWKDEVTYLRSWIRKRLAWVDANLAGTCAAQPAPAAVPQVAYPPPVMLAPRRPDPGLPMQTPGFVPPDVAPADPALAAYACPK